ncbi:MAG: hypothetical protein WD042_11700 [Phycisphaeraceae bacterium]
MLNCLICSSEFTLAEALLAPVNTPAEPQAKIAASAPSIGIHRLPWDHNRVCPNCKWPLTYAQATGQLSLHPIAITGGPGVSKSHYIPVLVDQAKRRLRQTIPGFDMRAQETREPGAAYSVCSDQLLATRYGRLFCDDQAGMVIAKTPRADGDSRQRTPLIYRFTFPSAWKLFTTRRKCVEFAFRDCAGEEFTEPGAMQEFHRYITQSAGILLLIDPTTVPGLRERLPRFTGAGRGAARPFEFDQIVSRLVGLFERTQNVAVGTRIRTPLAIVLTKADMLRELPGDAGAIFRQRDLLHCAGFNRQGVQTQQEWLRRLLVDCGQGSILSSVEANFQTFGLFAVSALGHSPTLKLGADGQAEQQVGHLQPWRVLDPLVWLLHHYGYVKASKETAVCSS